ncbi:MAG: J domain-containing protein [Ktedonobacteraceae bacterium]
MAVTLILEFASEGWHVRWRCSSTEEFQATREAFKDTLALDERYWDEEAFDGKGGWWVVYGALDKVGHLFANYAAVREELERAYWRDYWQQQQEARERFSRQQVKEKEQQKKQQQQTKQKQKQQGQQKKTERQRTEPPPPKRKEEPLPKSAAEALAILHVSPPASRDAVKRAYRAAAFKAHPDHGGSHAAMIRINAAYELAMKAC